MNNKQAIKQLKSLREFQYKFINDERFVDTEKIKNDIEALDMAITDALSIRKNCFLKYQFKSS
ncbi:hypothetical protein [Clostridium butyricum]